MKLAAIDIGTNAVRLQISSVLNVQEQGEKTVKFKKLEYIRFPLRLGTNVFKNQKITPKKVKKLSKLLRAFKILLKLYKVDETMICATAAIREAENGKQIVKHIKDKLGLEIEIITGKDEADMISKVILNKLDDKNYLHIDVGGGSTELNLYVNKEKVASSSFKIGTVRILNGKIKPERWEKMEKWIIENVKSDYLPITAIGTGGSISKIYDLSLEKLNIETADDNQKLEVGSWQSAVGNQQQINKTISLDIIKKVQQYLMRFTEEERINKLMLNPDRADVVIPASKIYLSVMKWAKAEKIIVPEVGLKDGMIQTLYEKGIGGIRE